MIRTPDRKPTTVVKHSLLISGHRTSVSLENVFWTALKQAATDRALSVAALVAEIDEQRGDASLSSAIRVHLLGVAMGAVQPAVARPEQEAPT